MTKVSLRARKKAARRERILDTAVELIAKRGFDAVSVDEIAAAAEVGKGTVYNYFAAKDDMIAAFVADLERRAFESLPAMGTTGSAGEVLDRAAWHVLSAKKRHHRFVLVFFARLFAGGEAFRAGLGEFQALFDRALGALLDTMKARGVVHASIDPGEFVLGFKTLQMGLSALWAIEGPPFTAARRMTRLHMHALGASLAS